MQNYLSPFQGAMPPACVGEPVLLASLMEEMVFPLTSTYIFFKGCPMEHQFVC